VAYTELVVLYGTIVSELSWVPREVLFWVRGSDKDVVIRVFDDKELAS